MHCWITDCWEGITNRPDDKTRNHMVGTVCISDLKQNKMTPNTDKCKTPCLVCLLYIPKMRRLLDSRSCEKNKTKISLVNLQSAH